MPSCYNFWLFETIKIRQHCQMRIVYIQENVSGNFLLLNSHEMRKSKDKLFNSPQITDEIASLGVRLTKNYFGVYMQKKKAPHLYGTRNGKMDSFY